MSLPPCIMAVDDEEELAHLFKEVLKGSGFNTVSFTDPLLVLRNYCKNSDEYTLINTDLKMPNSALQILSF